jgi:hypothetical protein
LDNGWRRDGSFRKSGTLGVGAKAKDESPSTDNDGDEESVVVEVDGDDDRFLPDKLSHLDLS